MRVSVISAERSVFDGEAESVVAPASRKASMVRSGFSIMRWTSKGTLA